PIILLLRMNERVSVAFGSRCEQEGGFFRLREAEGVVRAKRTDLQGWDRQFEIINRTGRRCEMKNVIDLVRDKQILCYVLLDEAVILVTREVLDVREVPGDQVVDCDHPMTFGQKTVGQMRAEKPGAARNHSDGL